MILVRKKLLGGGGDKKMTIEKLKEKIEIILDEIENRFDGRTIILNKIELQSIINDTICNLRELNKNFYSYYGEEKKRGIKE